MAESAPQASEPTSAAPAAKEIRRLVVMALALVAVVIAVVYLLNGSPDGTLHLSRTSIARPARDSLPAIELQRQQEEKAAPVAVVATTRSDLPVRLMPGGGPMALTKISDTHYQLAEPSSAGEWFMFQVRSASGKTIRFDITGPGRFNVADWMGLNPVITYAADLNDPANYQTTGGNNHSQHLTSWEGAELPDSAAEQWHYIPDAWTDVQGRTFSFVVHFDKDSAIVAMHIPHPNEYNEKFLHGIASHPDVTVIPVGKTFENHDLMMVKIGAGGDDAERKKPCVVIYAAELGEQPEAMWVAQGVIERLLEDTPHAKDLRERFTFIVIPQIEPDAVGTGIRALISFISKSQRADAVACADWFEAWVNAGKRIDMVFALANVQAEAPMLECYAAESAGERGTVENAWHHVLAQRLQSDGYLVAPEPSRGGRFAQRFGGWLSLRFGTLGSAYEICANNRQRHLDLAELKGIGASLADAVPEFFSTHDGDALQAMVDTCRKKRLDRLAKHGSFAPGTNPLRSEYDLSGEEGITGVGEKTMY